MLKALLVIGTRPEVIKMGPVAQALAQHSDRARFKICVTSQHRELLEQALQIFGIVPDYNLEVMTRDQSPTQVAATVLERIEPVLRSEKPDWVLLEGDTTTVAAASLAAFYQKVSVGHVEAGLRTYDRFRPFPEEMHRRIVGVVADLHFAPTELARRNLLREGTADRDIVVTGNPVVDAVRWVAAMPFDPKRLPIPEADPPPRVLLVTAHRRESFGRPFENICLALRDIAQRYGPGVQIVYPVHPNPNVQGPVFRFLSGLANVALTPPLDYVTFVQLLRRSYLVLTDSGGVQEEAPCFGVPILVLRECTERAENIETGTAKLVGHDPHQIVSAATQLLDDSEFYSTMSLAVNPYGDGTAGSRIVKALFERVQTAGHSS